MEGESTHNLWDLAGAFRELAAKAPQGATVELTVKGVSTPLPGDVQFQLLRVGQEAVSDAIRHFRGSLVRIELKYDPEFVMVRIQDNGIGFDPEMEPRGRRCFGRERMRERIERCGGEFAVYSAPEKGTAIVAWVPVPSYRDS